MTEPDGVRGRLARGAPLVGTFVKTPAPQIVELLGAAGLDFVAIDAEHAPFGLAELDGMAIAARAAGIAMLVRVPGSDAGFIGGCLDLGAAGVIVPHVRSAAAAADVAAAVRYAGGRRSFSPSTRAAGYGTRGDGHAARADAEVSLWCQIEDADALAELDAIAAVPGVDCLFLGPADLALSLGLSSPADPAMAAPSAAIAAACRRHGRTAGTFVPGPDDVAKAVAAGFGAVICGSDQSALLLAGRRLAALSGTRA